MSFLDVLIIYLACGAPSSVFEFTRTDRNPTFGKFGKAVLSLFFWPVHLSILLGFTILSVRQRTKHEKIEMVRKKVESAVFGDAPSRRIFEFRDAFYRTAYIAAAAAAYQPENVSQELFRFINHPSPELAARCAGRRDDRKMRHHLECSSKELLGLVEAQWTKLAIDGTESNLDALTAELEEFVPGAALHLSGRLFKPTETVQAGPPAVREI